MWLHFSLSLIASLVLSSVQVQSKALKLVGKWSAINVKAENRVAVICGINGVATSDYQARWQLTDSQKNRTELMTDPESPENYSVLKMNPPIRPEDAGDYVCVLNDTTNNRIIAEEKFTVSLYEAEKELKLNVSVSNPILGIHEDEDAVWEITIDTPTPKFTIEPDFFVDMRYQTECAPSQTDRYLCKITMKNARQQDSNQYGMVVHNEFTKKPVSLTLMVLGEIKYDILKVPSVFTFGMKTDIICMVRGPVALKAATLIRKNLVKWQYFECDMPCQNGTEIPMSTISNGTQNEDRGALTYTLQDFSPKKSGVIKCHGVNSKGEAEEATMQVCISDGPNQLTKNSEELTKGGHFNLSCAISICNYNQTAGIKWYFTAEEVNGEVTSLDNATKLEAIPGDSMPSRHSIEITAGQQSLQSVLKVTNASTGTYVCRADPIANDPSYLLFNVK